MPSFHNLYAQGFLRMAAGAPHVRAADPAFNVGQILSMCRAADSRGAGIAAFPELSLSAYAIDDLLHQEALLAAVETAATMLIEASRDLLPVILVGAPVRWRARLWNCALVIHRGTLLGVVPKSYLPNYREFYERRHFASGVNILGETVRFAGADVPFGIDLLFEATDVADFVLAAEICEDVWVPVPPSAYAALAGATIVANLSASDVVVGKADYRHLLCKAHSGRCLAAYVYTASGLANRPRTSPGTGSASSTRMARSLPRRRALPPIPRSSSLTSISRFWRRSRMRQVTFGDNADAVPTYEFRRVPFALAPPLEEDLGLERRVSRYPSYRTTTRD